MHSEHVCTRFLLLDATVIITSGNLTITEGGFGELCMWLSEVPADGVECGVDVVFGITASAGYSIIHKDFSRLELIVQLQLQLISVHL